MKVIQGILGFIIGLLDNLLPALGVPDTFFILLNGAIVFIVDLLRTAAYFIPLDVLIMCLGIMIAVDNFALLMRVGQFILKLIRG